MSYSHPILVPGAPGHEDVEALHKVIEELSNGPSRVDWRELLDEFDNAKIIVADIEDDLSDALDPFQDDAEHLKAMLKEIRDAVGSYGHEAHDHLDVLEAIVKETLEQLEDLKALVKSMEHTHSQADRY